MNLRHDQPRQGVAVRVARNGDDLLACQRLRHLCFFGTAGLDADAHDERCTHLMIERDGALLGTLRTLLVADGTGLSDTLTAASYDLSPLVHYPHPILEIGRFCIAPGALDSHVLRLALGALARMVDDHAIGLMMGCTSLPGADPARHAPALALLGRHHLGPADLRPGVRSAVTHPLSGPLSDRRGATAALPALLRSYLGLGGWVSDHAVVDHAMDTVHVFTCVEVARIPPARARALRQLAS
ncbi:GNAT family N-acetyltransferase [Loktanella sp. SALINAS62]|uniref:GNAT family N-acetyltransferase n=1 Tax=Loktanella sp. SALINAS62 TaxID=2706124 RepID=UPI001B8C2B50|nr:GNAT family N-acetyltransferase [Loktanella sp. SALINAS62]MBS1304155.1 GNAT family N-acetyltransferase [Loktanella sp. SALINAS62]